MNALIKDCDCMTHDGPHWLHMDRLWLEQNRRLLREAEELSAHGAHYAAMFRYEAFRREEIARLRERKYHLLRLGLTEIPKQEGGDPHD